MTITPNELSWARFVVWAIFFAYMGHIGLSGVISDVKSAYSWLVGTAVPAVTTEVKAA